MKKTHNNIRSLVRCGVLLLFAALLPQLTTVFAQTNAFTYQGQLTESGSPANGTYDLRFQLFDQDAPGGSSLGDPVTNLAVAVSGGLFTVTLDFGSAYFATGADRWLEIRSRTNGGAFGLLTPRQQITSTPYAITAANVTGTLDAAKITIGTIDNARLNATVSLLGTSIEAGEIAANAVTSAKIADGTITSDDIADGMVSTTDIADGTIANVDISSSAAIGHSKLANATPGQVLLANGSSVITATTISGDATMSSAGAVTLAASSVNSSKIQDNTVASTDILNGTILDVDIAGSAAIDGSKLSPNVALLDRSQQVFTGTNTFGKVIISTNNAGSTTSVSIGERWRDNAIVAWGKVANGTLGTNSFGVSSMISNAVGSYTFTLNNGFSVNTSLIPVASAEVDSQPTTAAAARITYVDQLTTTTFRVWISDGNWSPVNNDFVFIVTGR